MTRRQVALASTALVGLLALVGCGDEESPADPTTSDPTGTTSGEPEVTDDVTLTLQTDMDGPTLLGSATAGAALVLLPVGEPERSETDDGVTLTYLRPDPDDAATGDEPELYEALRLPTGNSTEIARPSLVETPITLRYCVEVVPETDVAAPAGDGVFRVDGRESGADPIVACSDYTTVRDS